MDSSTTTQMAQIMVQYGRPSPFLLSKICTVILWQDCYGKGNLRKSYCSTFGRRFPIGNAYSYTVKKDHSCLCTWMTSNWLERNKTLTQCGKYSWKKSIWAIQHHALTMSIWVVLNESVKRAKILWTTIEICLNPKSVMELQKSYFVLRNLAQTFPHGPMIWNVMQRNAWNDTANWRTKRLNNFSKSQLDALPTTNSRKQKWDLLENCQRFAHKLF